MHTPTTAPQDFQNRHSLNWERWALLSGIGFSLLQIALMVFVAIYVLPLFISHEAPVANQRAGYLQHGELLRFTNFLLTLPAPIFLFFLGGLYSAVLRIAPRNAVLAIIIITAGTAMAMLWPLGAVLNSISIDIARNSGDMATVVAMDALPPYLLALGALPRVVLLLATSLAFRSEGSLPRWLPILGFLLAIVSLTGSATLFVSEMFPVLALGTVLFHMWLIALCMALLKGQAQSL